MSDDFVINVRQIAQYPTQDVSAPTDAILFQSGGIGGPYRSIDPVGLVEGALLAGIDGLVFDGIELFVPSSVTVARDPIQALEVTSKQYVDGNLAATTQAILAEATAALEALDNKLMEGIHFLDCRITGLYNNTVWSFNGRRGVVELKLDDITDAGGAPLDGPIFSGWPQAPTPTNPPQSANQLATVGWVHDFILTDGVRSFNGRHGDIQTRLDDIVCAGGAPIFSPIFTGNPRAPTPKTSDISTRIATTQYVQRRIDDAWFDLDAIARAGWVQVECDPPHNPHQGELWWDTESGALFIWYDQNGGQWVITNAVGPMGPPGQKGAPGNPGATGPAGTPGAQGPKGDPGDTFNIKGHVATEADLPTTGNVPGDIWITDDTNTAWLWVPNEFLDIGTPGGEGPPGPPGPIGPAGPQGVAGNQGAQGPPGSVGPAGSAGPVGPMGVQGLQGNVGPRGPDVFLGPTAPASPQVGWAWFNTTSNTLSIWDGTQWQPVSSATTGAGGFRDFPISWTSRQHPCMTPGYNFPDGNPEKVVSFTLRKGLNRISSYFMQTVTLSAPVPAGGPAGGFMLNGCDTTYLYSGGSMFLDSKDWSTGAPPTAAAIPTWKMFQAYPTGQWGMFTGGGGFGSVMIPPGGTMDSTVYSTSYPPFMMPAGVGGNPGAPPSILTIGTWPYYNLAEWGGAAESPNSGQGNFGTGMPWFDWYIPADTQMFFYIWPMGNMSGGASPITFQLFLQGMFRVQEFF